ncbi:MAG: hypothetical protein V4622_13940, partial [Bacteroidota bacterium]
MKCFLIFLIVFFNGNLFSQSLKITVIDEKGVFLENCKIYKNKIEISPELKENYFLLKVKFNDTITINCHQFKGENFVVPKVENEELFHVVELKRIFQELDEVTITSEKYKKMAGEKNENILDYLFYPKENTFVFIKSIKNNYFLEIKTESSSKEILLNFHPEELFLDCLGNTHILSKDSAYQIWFADSLKYVSTISKKMFDTNLKTLVAKTEKSIFYEKITQHNQLYNLTKSTQEVSDSAVCTIFDKVAYKVARSEYNEIIGMYYFMASEVQNIIEAGIWDGDVVKLGIHYKIVEKIGWYLNVRAKPILCSSYGMLDKICLVNLVENEIFNIDYSGNSIKKIPFSSSNLKNKKVI